MGKKILITEPQHFAFKFIGENDGKGIPAPLPDTVIALNHKGLVKIGPAIECKTKVRCYLTPLGKSCYKPSC